jgi:tetratricopeptide (TPR) repeat protein
MANPKSSSNESLSPQKPAASPSTPGPVPALFRPIDWLALLVTFAVVWTAYFLTLAPELTLEDSGELVTASYYAGIPHPPGYPVWTMYSWLWTVLVPVGPIAWRVGLGQATSTAFACGLLAFLVSRGSSMFMESIEDLKNMTGKWEKAICLVAGFVAGVLLGLDGFIWRESIVVNRIAVFSLPWFMMLLVCFLRWLYAPHQMRYAYAAALLFGVCITIHQSLVTAAIGFEIVIALGNRRMGRNAFFGNFLIYIGYMAVWAFTGQHLFANIGKPGMFAVFNLVGIASVIACIWLTIQTKDFLKDWLPIPIMFVLFCVGVAFYFYMPISCMTNAPMQWGYPRTVEGFFHAISRGQYEQPNPTDIINDPGRFMRQLQMLVGGVADEFTWVYMFIALVPFAFFLRMQKRERAWMISLSSMYLCIGVLLMILLNPSLDRASADLIRVFLTSSHTIIALFIGYGLALTAAYMATHYQKFRIWGLAGGGVAILLAIYCLYDGTAKSYFGRAAQMPFWELPHWVAQAFAPNQYGLSVFANLLLIALSAAFVAALFIYRQRGPLLITLGIFACMPIYSGLDHWFNSEQRNHWFGYWFGHDMFTPPFKGSDGKPLYPEMAKDAILFGGTDPGRFCPEYMIYVESFTPHHCQPVQDQKFDRRDVYIITQNALADGTYLCFIRSHYNRSAQIDPPFFREFCRTAIPGLKDKEYETNLLARMVTPLDNIFTAHGTKVERRRRTYTSYFTEKDFLDMPALAGKLQQPDPVSKFVFEQLSPETQKLITSKSAPQVLGPSLAKDLNRLIQQDLPPLEDPEGKKGPALYDPERFKGVSISEYLADFIKQNPQSHTRIRLNRLLLEAAYPVEIAKTIGGVYPDREIYTPTIEDSQDCFQEYLANAQKRLQHDMQFPNEPRQIKPGEDVHIVDNKVQVSGQVAVMAINGLLTKVIFDHNPKNEFYVEESFPLDWMYPYLSPFGVIMKINRHQLPELSEDIVRHDHEFWSQYATRFTGDWLKYETPVKEICDWIEKVYLRRDFNGFTGDRKFIRDEDGQKAFSKLRSSIGGIYAWRINDPNNRDPQVRQRMIKEADFAFRQAFLFCPFSPEAVFRYVNLLLSLQRFDDALLVAQTCLKLDPFNSQVSDLIRNLQSWKAASGGQAAAQKIQQLQKAVEANPGNLQSIFDLAGAYLQSGYMDEALSTLDIVLNNPQSDAVVLRTLIQAYSSMNNNSKLQATVGKLEALYRADSNNLQAILSLSEGYHALHQDDQANKVLGALLESPQADPNTILQAAQQFSALMNYPKLEASLEKLVKLAPTSAEAWYDLSALKAATGKTPDAISALRQAIDLSNKRLLTNPKAPNLAKQAKDDQRFGALRDSAEFKQLTSAK